VTPRADVPFTLFGFAVLYLLLGVALVALLRGLARHRHTTADDGHAR
jgi:cytochrome bd-type quinol oxidase subunit 1